MGTKNDREQLFQIKQKKLRKEQKMVAMAICDLAWPRATYCGLVWPFYGLAWHFNGLLWQNIESSFLAVLDPNSFGLFLYVWEILSFFMAYVCLHEHFQS